ncbi:MAG: SpoIIE family protein phosphatase [Rhodospirillales bacterium]
MNAPGAPLNTPVNAPGAAAREIRSHLDLLADMAASFASHSDLDETLLVALRSITEHVGAEAGSLFMLEDGETKLRCHASIGAVDVAGLEIGASQGIVGKCVQTDSGVIVRDVSQDPDFFGGVDEQTGFVTKSILCAPMSVKGQKVGAVELINKRGGEGLFAEEDLMLLSTLGVSAAMAVLNSRMAGAEAEQERTRREIELAAEIQRSLLPEAGKAEGGVTGLNIPARTVSGDFFDHFALDDGRVGFCVGDVSGKGMNAALMMAKAASLYRCLGRAIHAPGRLMTLINEEICETATRGMFVTIAGGVYDPASGVVRLANAGHEPPLLRSPEGGYTEYPAAAPPIGIISGGESTRFETEIRLDGGALYVFTDGVTEGYTAAKSELGVEGVKRILDDCAAAPPRERLMALADALRARPEELRDDITMIVIDDAPAKAAREAAARTQSTAGAEYAGQGAPKDAGQGGQMLELNAPARPESLKLIRAGVLAAAQEAGFSELAARDVVLAVDEACQNVIRHAYKGRGDGEVVIGFERRGRTFTVLVRDFAPPVDPENIRPRALDDVRPGGLGTHLIREIMDEVEFMPPPEGGGNLLRLAKTVV